MDFQEKSKLIYQSVLVILFIVFLAILYQYSENGRFTYHKEITDGSKDRYVVDTRTGTIYGNRKVILSINIDIPEYFYKIDLKTGKVWYMSQQVIEDSRPKSSPHK